MKQKTKKKPKLPSLPLSPPPPALLFGQRVDFTHAPPPTKPTDCAAPSLQSVDIDHNTPRQRWQPSHRHHRPLAPMVFSRLRLGAPNLRQP